MAPDKEVNGDNLTNIFDFLHNNRPVCVLI